MSDYDDRMEVPEGIVPELADLDHPFAAAWRSQPPALLGYNRVGARPEARVVATVGGDVLLATMEVGRGRSLAWTSVIGPHWCPDQFA